MKPLCGYVSGLTRKIPPNWDPEGPSPLLAMEIGVHIDGFLRIFLTTPEYAEGLLVWVPPPLHRTVRRLKNRQQVIVYGKIGRVSCGGTHGHKVCEAVAITPLREFNSVAVA